MTKIEMLFNYLFWPLVILAILLAALMGLNRTLIRYQQKHPERQIQRLALMFAATILALFFFIVFLPISEGLRGQILSLLGILLSAMIALSSTTFLGNALAGVLLRSVRSFRTGDFIYIREHFGRVSGRGLFHIEIQTEDRDLVTLPNLFVTNNPVKVTRESGTIVSSEVSLGYDVPRNQVESLLQKAATEAGLEDPFVYIMKLGDFSILYRVNGMLTDIKQQLSTRSRLNGAILDIFHSDGIEIVSPNFMNTRDVGGQTFAARPLIKDSTPIDAQDPEEIIFDKAEKAATLEEQKASLTEIEKRLASVEAAMPDADGEKKAKLTGAADRLKREKARISQKITAEEKAMDKEKPKT